MIYRLPTITQIYSLDIDWIDMINTEYNKWRLTVIAATVRIALVDILDLSEVDIPAGGFL